MQTIELAAKARTELGKNYSKQFRKNGSTPAVVYGAKSEPAHILVDSKEVGKFYRNYSKQNVLVKITINNNGSTSEVTAFLKEFAKNHLTQEILHVDFMKVDETHPIKADIQLKFIGAAPGVKKGGQLMTKLRQLKIKALPQNIPDTIDIDLSTLEVGQSIRVKDIDTKGLFNIEVPGNEIIILVESLKAAETPAAASK